MSEDQPRTRLEVLSRGLGKLAGAVTMLLIGAVVLVANALSGPNPTLGQMGQTMLVMGGALLVWGIIVMVRGVNAAHKDIVCPHCQTSNELLAHVDQFKCFECGKPLKLVRKGRGG